MAKEHIRHSCSTCGFSAPRWFGRCPDCGAWNSATDPASASGAPDVLTLAEVGVADERVSVGLPEVDRVLGGGLVPGSVCLLAGEPGIGKSTLLLQLVHGAASAGSSLLVTAEESLPQVTRRAARLKVDLDSIRGLSTSSLTDALAAARAGPCTVLIVDSIQAIEDPDIDGSAGSLVQVRECAAKLVRFAKQTGTAVVIVGHVTKDGAVAGPKTLEHAVDTVLSLEGERTGSLRLLRVVKNRFGSCEETGVFMMTATGLEGVPDPSAMLLADRSESVSGSIVFPSMQGTRPVLVEIQALVTRSEFTQPRRVAIGVDAKRLALLIGILKQHSKVDLSKSDVFVAAAGGVILREPAADLAICLALRSALDDVALDARMVAVGETGLGGEIRRVPDVRRRLVEAARLGFDHACIPPGSSIDDLALRATEVSTVRSAFSRVSKVSRVDAA